MLLEERGKEEVERRGLVQGIKTEGQGGYCPGPSEGKGRQRENIYSFLSSFFPLPDQFQSHFSMTKNRSLKLTVVNTGIEMVNLQSSFVNILTILVFIVS